MVTRKEYFVAKITNYLAELNKLNMNAQAQKFNKADYQEYLADWNDILYSLHDCSTEFAKENLK